MGNWGNLGVNWTSAGALKGSNAVFKELSECWGERSFAKKTDSWARIPQWFGGGFDFSYFISAFDGQMNGFLTQNNPYIDHLVQLEENYWNYNPGAGEVQWKWWYGIWLPSTWTEARYLEVSGDSEIINLDYGFPYGLASVTPEYLYQKRKILDLCRWRWDYPLTSVPEGYIGGLVERKSDWSQIRFCHPKSITSNTWLANGASIGKIPAHTWEVWDQRDLSTMQGYYDLKTRKVYSETIESDIQSTDADYHYSPWLTVAGIRGESIPNDEWYCLFTQWTFIYKCESGFQYKDW